MRTVRARILVLEDDLALGERVRALLGAEGFSVNWWRKGRLLTSEDVRELDLVVLDLMLPQLHGLDVLRSLRADGHRDLPVIVLSAREEAETRVRALRLGADDYLVKPFFPEELVERVRTRLRRPTIQGESPITVGGLLVDPVARTVSRNSEPLELTRTELSILLVLARRAGEAITRKELSQQVLDPEREAGVRALDVHVSNLRKKLGVTCVLETVWGIGYRLRADPSQGGSR